MVAIANTSGKTDLDVWNLVVASELYQSEHGGKPNKVFTASWAAPGNGVVAQLLNSTKPDNSSGISFGLVQLDIGAGNPFGVQAYETILSNAFGNGVITQDEFDHLLTYIGMNRSEIQAAYRGSTVLQAEFKNDLNVLNALFSTTDAKDIIVNASLQQTQTIVTAFFTGPTALYDNMQHIWSDGNSVFSSTNPDYYSAMAVLIATKNRQGSLGGDLVSYLETHEITSLADLKAAYAIYKPSLLSDERGGWFDRVANDGGAAAQLMLEHFQPSLPVVHCFPATTQIALASGGFANIKDIKVGDVILAFNPFMSMGRRL